jgi:outer membrane receptor protein involved in Fe transport
MITRLFGVGLALSLAVPALGQNPPQNPPPTQTARTAQPSQDPDPDDVPTFTDQVVVTASRVEQQLVDAPAAVSIVTASTIQNSPATNIGDLLRAVPGLNVTQVSARDVNLTSRGATSTLSTSQLALVDGRSIYMDFYGMVMWDFVPSNPNEIKQIEVIRGPASAVWGANAMSGVVNILTKTPRELAAGAGSSLTIGVGIFPTSAQGVTRDAGSLFYVNGSHAEAVDDHWAFKLSAGYFTQDPLARPIGSIPGNAMNTQYPPYVNTGTSQPKFDARVDYTLANGASLVFSGGVAGTEGIMHTGIGPFDIQTGARLGYLSARFQQGARRVAFFTNMLNGDAVNLLSRGATGAFLPLGFDTKTFDVETGEARAIGTHHALSYGGNFRHNTFDVTIAPNGEARNEGGVYGQDEIFLGNHVRWVVGGRVDKFSSIEKAVFSPRTTLLLKPSVDQTIRVSFNQAFRAPSFINNHLQTTVLNQINLSAISPALANFVLPVGAVGNRDLKQETLTAVELGYAGSLGRRATVSASVYWNHTKDGIFFTQVGCYTPATSTAAWPGFIPTAVIGLIPGPACAGGRGLPSVFSYRNLGTVRDRGIEVGVDAAVTRYVNAFVNYSYQADPDIEGFDPLEANVPPNNRFNAGFNFSRSRFLGNLSVSYTDEAYWQDVLDARFAGVTDAFTLVSGGFGVRWMGDRVVTSIKATNLGNQEIQQHIFGDITRRQVVGEARFTF